MTLCYHEGQFRPLEEIFVPLSDLAIQRGIGVFESIRTYDRRTFALGPHLERLARSAEQAGIEARNLIPQVRDILREGLARPDCPQGEVLMKPYLTGGDVREEGRFPHPRLFVLFEPLHAPDPNLHREGVTLQPAAMERPFPLIKSINYLFGYIPVAGMEGVFETLYCPGGEITESSSSNFFLCVEGKLVTAPVGRVLSGVTRGIVLHLAREGGFKVEERCPKVTELEKADEAFVTGSLKEILGVVRIGGHRIGKGTPGPVTQHLHRLFRTSLQHWLD
ncbi:aminotransferase class IV [Aminomonas paucivorans DSM 12260]|uniref:Aminotransferase class IV n=1 Tax=Aminomonas paucivorans DSM 12260 TaxID=584708 RepID=E3CZ10_9BACT|nr:aminotransferase class IV [Aminomonas paucivorans]EFQ22783.1 aminotransferase class IV [Aminomonas paucivorans DSM 12260]